MGRTATGITVGVASSIAIGLVGIPLRSHIAVATGALILVIPVVAGVALGGSVAGLASAAAGFFAYDLVFLPPYFTLDVRDGEDWVALLVYAVVVALVARVVAHLDVARNEARSREIYARHLVDLSELLLSEQTPDELAPAITARIHEVLGIESVALVVERDGRLEVLGAAGAPLPAGVAGIPTTEVGTPVAMSTRSSDAATQTVALTAGGRPIGLLLLGGVPIDPALREVLPIFANQLALALEQAELRVRAGRAAVLEEIDRLRHALVSAVSHDLRTPLATIKVASSTLVGATSSIDPAVADELYDLIDVQTDRLTRLVTNLLDMTRIEAGVLAVRAERVELLDLITDVVVALRPALDAREVVVQIPESTPTVWIDAVLIAQVITNLLDNADRLAPESTPITVSAEVESPGFVTVAVSDHGPGVSPDRRAAVFDTFVGFDTGGRSGVGLAISKAFVEAHGGQITVDERRGGGARFAFTVPVAPAIGEG